MHFGAIRMGCQDETDADETRGGCDASLRLLDGRGGCPHTSIAGFLLSVALVV
jgi:hypothetical protein